MRDKICCQLVGFFLKYLPQGYRINCCLACIYQSIFNLLRVMGVRIWNPWKGGSWWLMQGSWKTCFYYNVILDVDDHSCSFLYLLDIGFALTHSIFSISRYFPKQQPELLCFYTCWQIFKQKSATHMCYYLCTEKRTLELGVFLLDGTLVT